MAEDSRFTYRQIPFEDAYWAKLEVRADENDRIPSREAFRIIKDVLDGRYQPVAGYNVG
jgi:hypothetical protein